MSTIDIEIVGTSPDVRVRRNHSGVFFDIVSGHNIVTLDIHHAEGVAAAIAAFKAGEKLIAGDCTVNASTLGDPRRWLDVEGRA